MANEDNPHIISYLTLRQLLGGLGIFLPVILIMGSFLSSNIDGIQESISMYYHTSLRDVFVVVVSAFGLFLFAYTGYKSIDNWLSNIAGISALLVVFFPTSEGDCAHIICSVHFVSAASFLLLLAIISFFLFTKSNKPYGQRTAQKHLRNKIYRTCGIIIFICLILLAIYFQFVDQSQFPETTIFWLESIALWAFGFSWMVKGETFFTDK